MKLRALINVVVGLILLEIKKEIQSAHSEFG